VAVEFSIDTREFQDALKLYMKYTKKTLAEAVNHRAINITFKAIQYTKATTLGKIKREMWRTSRKHPGVPVLALLANKYVAGKDQRFAGKYKALKNAYGPKGITPKNTEDFTGKMGAAMDMLWDLKQRSRGFIKAGWFGAINDLRPFVKIKRKPPKNIQGDGAAKKLGMAKPAFSGINPTAEIINRVNGAVKVGAKPLHRAIKADADDMMVYVRRKMQEEADKFQDSKARHIYYNPMNVFRR